MDKKIKILLIFMGVFSLAAAGISGWIYFSSRAEVAEYAEKEAQSQRAAARLQEKLDSTQEETRRWREKSESITAALNKLGKEHAIVQRQFTSLIKEKDSLIQNTKALSAQLEELDKLYSQAKEKAELNTSDKFLASLLEEKAQLEVELEKLMGEISSQQLQAEESLAQTHSIEGEFTQLKEEKEKLEVKLADARKVSDLLSNDLLQEIKKRAVLEQGLANAQNSLKDIEEEKGRIAGQLAQMKQELEQKSEQLAGMEQKLQQRLDESASIVLSPIIVKADEKGDADSYHYEAGSVIARSKVAEATEDEMSEGAPSPLGEANLKGRIITVNERHGFVVIDIGRDEGVEQGMAFEVYRQGEKVGRIEVIETRKNISACNIKEMAAGGLSAGDTARR